jgi:hypothetical protein
MERVSATPLNDSDTIDMGRSGHVFALQKSGSSAASTVVRVDATGVSAVTTPETANAATMSVAKVRAIRAA